MSFNRIEPEFTYDARRELSEEAIVVQNFEWWEIQMCNCYVLKLSDARILTQLVEHNSKGDEQRTCQ